MEKENNNDELKNLPDCAVEFIAKVIKKMRYRRKVREDVQAELISHFEDELKDCKTDQERQEKAKRLISEFGDVKMLARLLRRAKKRCRPLWQKVLVKICFTLGFIFLYLIICVSPLMIGKPTIKIDYVKWLNESQQAGRDSILNAKTYYDKAAQLAVALPDWLIQTPAQWPSDLNDIELKKLTEWLEMNKKSIEMFREAADKPYYWSHYIRNVGNSKNLSQAIMPGIMEPLPDYRKAMFVMRENINYEAFIGDANQAMRDCFALMKFGYNIEDNGFIIEQLVGIAMESVAINEGFKMLDKVDVPQETLKSFQNKLKNLYTSDKPVLSFDLEKVFMYDLIQRSFTDDGKGDGKPINLRGFAYSVDSGWNPFKLLLFEYPSRKETLTQVEQYYKISEQFMSKSPLDLNKEGIDLNNWTDDDITKLNTMLDLNGPAFYRTNAMSWALRSQRNAIFAVLALLQYKNDKGEFPDEFDEIVKTGFLDKLPKDPYSNKPMVYMKNNKGNFILYSVGRNLIDDGGKMGTDSQGRKQRLNTDNGDWIYWPITESQK